MPLLSSHEPLAASRMEQSEFPPAVRVSPADPESRTRAIQNSVTVNHDRRTLQKKHAGKSFMVVKSFLHCALSGSTVKTFKEVRQHQQQ